MRHTIGSPVTWTSQSHGSVVTKTGQVVEVVPPGRFPTTKMRTMGMPRDKESYVVLVKRIGRNGEEIAPQYYWPKTSQLGGAQ